MKLRKARKKTFPTRKKEPLFTYEMRQQALKQAVEEVNALVEAATQVMEQFNKNCDVIFNPVEIRDRVKDNLYRDFSAVEVWYEEGDPYTMHFKGVTEPPVEKVAVECFISEEKDDAQN